MYSWNTMRIPARRFILYYNNTYANKPRDARHRVIYTSTRIALRVVFFPLYPPRRYRYLYIRNITVVICTIGTGGGTVYEYRRQLYFRQKHNKYLPYIYILYRCLLMCAYNVHRVQSVRGVSGAAAELSARWPLTEFSPVCGARGAAAVYMRWRKSESASAAAASATPSRRALASVVLMHRRGACGNALAAAGVGRRARRKSHRRRPARGAYTKKRVRARARVRYARDR